MMGIAPIFFWFARLCMRLDCVSRRTWFSRGMMGRQGLQAVSEPRFQNVVLSGVCQGIESHYSGKQCIWQI